MLNELFARFDKLAEVCITTRSLTKSIWWYTDRQTETTKLTIPSLIVCFQSDVYLSEISSTEDKDLGGLLLLYQWCTKGKARSCCFVCTYGIVNGEGDKVSNNIVTSCFYHHFSYMKHNIITHRFI